jgi:5-formyltetrahydrofolate cyclo-ligase
LAQAPRPVAVGVAYQFALTAFAADPHDIALDAVLTDEGEY